LTNTFENNNEETHIDYTLPSGRYERKKVELNEETIDSKIIATREKLSKLMSEMERGWLSKFRDDLPKTQAILL
jgi:hypothetical protein